MTAAQTQRNFQDVNVRVTKALPAAAANNNSDSIDLGHAFPGRSVDKTELVINLPATPSLADDKTVIITLQDSADGSSFAAVTGVSTIVATGAGGVGAAAIERRIKLPTGVRRYIRFNQAVLTAGGDNTAVSTTMGLRF